MKIKLVLVLFLSQIIVGCGLMSQSRIAIKPVDEEKTSIASFPSDLRGAYIRKSKKYTQSKVKLVLTDEKGNITVGKDGKIQTVEVDRTYFDSVLSICAEPPADTGSNSTFALAGSLSNQLAANSAATASLSSAISNANTKANSKSTSESQKSGDSDESSSSQSGDGNNSSESSRSSSSESGLTNSASNNLAVQANLNLSREVVELQGRTQLVLLAREFMYRNCEAAANGYISREDYLTLHKASINQISEMLKASVSKAEAQKKEAEAKKTEAEAKKVKAETEKQKVLNQTADINYQSQIKFCKNKLLTCNNSASGDKKKEASCSSEFDKCIIRK